MQAKDPRVKVILYYWEKKAFASQCFSSLPLVMPTAELYNSPGDRNTSLGDCRAAHLTWWQHYRYDSPSPPLEMPTAELHTSPGDRNTSPGDCRTAHLTALHVWLTQSTLGTAYPLIRPFQPHGWGGLSGIRPVQTWPNRLCISTAIWLKWLRASVSTCVPNTAIHSKWIVCQKTETRMTASVLKWDPNT